MEFIFRTKNDLFSDPLMLQPSTVRVTHSHWCVCVYWVQMKEITEWKFSGKSSLKSFSPTTKRTDAEMAKWNEWMNHQRPLHWAHGTKHRVRSIIFCHLFLKSHIIYDWSDACDYRQLDAGCWLFIIKYVRIHIVCVCMCGLKTSKRRQTFN